MNILISAGHYPTKPGACFEGFCEHDEAMRWVQEMALHLEGYAMIVPPGVLGDKVAFINARNPTVAVEIHFNSDPKRAGRGSETLHLPGSVKGRLLAEHVQKHVGDVFKPDRGVKEGYYQLNVAKGPDFFLSRTSCPAVIVEPEFIHNKELIIAERVRGAAAISQGILDYLDAALG